MSKIAVIIPTRLKSTRLPNKPLAIINNKPLIQHVYEHALQVHPEEDVYIAAGDVEILEAAKSFGAKCILTDPALPSGTDRIAAALDQIDPMGQKYDIVVNFQGDGINVDPKLNLQLVDLLEKQNADMTTVGIKITKPEEIANPNFVKIAMGLRAGENTGRALYFSRAGVPFNRDNVPAYDFAYWHIGIYVYRISALRKIVSYPVGVLENIEKLEQLRALENGMSIHALIVPTIKLIEDAPADINTPEELADAQKFLF
ncbi:MAG: 3-deoxy-manno-octulosonate cytidylyltransferase [Lactobacillales bacterium]|jgi:3-deoxy-manno-octulosonate cytidylyltransferase (CMP-KDO synthetase)|nr:3-deoxy-manno-octulosonate cytidylyltransferase [Lactobacillales bacterium]